MTAQELTPGMTVRLSPNGPWQTVEEVGWPFMDRLTGRRVVRIEFRGRFSPTWKTATDEIEVLQEVAA